MDRTKLNIYLAILSYFQVGCLNIMNYVVANSPHIQIAPGPSSEHCGQECNAVFGKAMALLCGESAVQGSCWYSSVYIASRFGIITVIHQKFNKELKMYLT